MMVGRVKGIWTKFSIESSAIEYAKLIDEMEQQFGRQRSTMALEAAKLKFETDPPTPAQLWNIALETQLPGTSAHLLDEPCRHGCNEGWALVPFDDLLANRKNKLIQMYGLETAKLIRQTERCQCWQ